ncbi:MAG: hypothetical protein ABI680_06700 [Chthoniobacteraceae bacterium]
MKIKSFCLLAIVSLSLTVSRLTACDLCGCAIPNHPWDPRAGVFFGAAEQFTRFDTIQVDGHEIRNPADQFMDSSITQLYLGYNLRPAFGVQLNVPLIYRSFRRTNDTGIQNGKVSGLGDISLLAHYVPIIHESTDFSFQARVRAGIKLPTGDSDLLGEEAEEGHSHESEEPGHDAEESGHDGDHDHGHESQDESALPESAVHGHDLTLGSGSVDGIIGGGFYLRYQRVFLTGDVQYAIRGEGSFDYRFANDFSFSAGPGVYLIDQPTHTLALHAIVSGETKGKDEFRGMAADDTAATTIFLGPRIAATWRDRFSAEVELDVPVSRDNSALQIVPDYRLRAAVSWAF